MQRSRPFFHYDAAIVLISLVLLASCGGGSGQNFLSSTSVSSPPPTIQPQVTTTRLSTDTFTNSSSQHATEVEPSAFVFGSTIVSAFQVGRIFSGGGADIGFATSTNDGVSWTSGFLPGTTTFAPSPGNYTAVSDPAVAYDAKHAVWLVASLGIGTKDQVLVSRSTDGVNWGNPILVSATPNADKDWIVCDNTATSTFYGNCYAEWDDPSTSPGDLIWMSTSSDGGLTWRAALNPSLQPTGLGGQPLVQPNGHVIVPYLSANGTAMLAYTSSDGGGSWGAPNLISTIVDHQSAGGLRTDPLPSAAMDASGKIYVIWQDCRFRTSCVSNDLVMSASTDGALWTAVARIPIDAVSSGADHFIPGLGVDPNTSGSTTRLGLTYYYYPVANCTAATCVLAAGFISSADGGNTWSATTNLTAGMSLSWLPNTFSGLMVGDYMATVYANGKAFPLIAIAKQNSGTVLDEAIYTTASGLSAALSMSKAEQSGVVALESDHPPRRFYDLEHRYPRPPEN